jgi:hypothetical protein
MDSIVPSIISILIFVIIGGSLDLILNNLYSRTETAGRSLIILIPKWFGMGVALHTFTFTVIGIIGVEIDLFLVSILVVGTSAIALIMQYYKKRSISWIQAPTSEDLLCCLILATLCLIVAVMRIATPSIEVDLFNHLISKSKFLLSEAISSMTFTNDEIFGTAHPKYPPAIPFIFNLPYLIFGAPLEGSFYSMNSWILFCIALCVYYIVSKPMGRLIGLFAAIVAISSRNIFGSLFFDNADLLMAFYLLISTSYLLLTFTSGERAELMATFCLLAGAALTKSEGLFSAFVLATIAVIYFMRNSSQLSFADRIFSLLPPAAILLLGASSWWIYQLFLLSPVEPLFINPAAKSIPYTPDVILIFIDKLAIVDWNFIFLAFLACLLVFFYRRKLMPIDLFTIMPLLLLIVVCGLLCIGQGHEITSTPYGPNVIYRAIGQVYPLATVAVFLLIGSLARGSLAPNMPKVIP